MNIAKMITKSVLVVLALSPPALFADSGLYIGGSIGSATLAKDLGSARIETKSKPYRLTLGLQLYDFLSIEGGYHNFGKFEDRFLLSGNPVDVGLKADGYTLGLVGNIPLGDKFSLFGRAGAFFWNGDALIDSALNGRVSAFFWDDDVYVLEDELYYDSYEFGRPGDTNAYFGAGAAVGVTDRFQLVGDWTRYRLEAADSDVVSIGFTYRF